MRAPGAVAPRSIPKGELRGVVPLDGGSGVWLVRLLRRRARALVGLPQGTRRALMGCDVDGVEEASYRRERLQLPSGRHVFQKDSSELVQLFPQSCPKIVPKLANIRSYSCNLGGCWPICSSIWPTCRRNDDNLETLVARRCAFWATLGGVATSRGMVVKQLSMHLARRHSSKASGTSRTSAFCRASVV